MVAGELIPEPVVIGSMQKNSRERVVVAIKEFRGRPFVDVRMHFQKGDEIIPTREGVTLRPELLAEFQKLVNAAIKAARDRGLIPAGVDAE